MNTWEAIFSQSPANDGYYNGEKLPQAHWEWPKSTWFQGRLDRIRENERPWNPRAGLRARNTAPLRTM